jgi:hypothetical protein
LDVQLYKLIQFISGIKYMYGKAINLESDPGRQCAEDLQRVVGELSLHGCVYG